MKYGFVVPVYNHGSALESVVKNIEGYNFPIIVVDDGNDEKNKNAIAEVVKNHPLCVLLTRQKNGGKGKALADGVRKADELGLTHVLQIDSDGQHGELIVGNDEHIFADFEVLLLYPAGKGSQA